MKKLLRAFGFLVIALVVILGGFVTWSWAPDIPVNDLIARYAPPPSTFVAIDGLNVHVRDEGPRDDPLPLVLIHGTSSSLHTWDGWVAALSGKRRVIRFDLPGFGLTGPNATNDYSIQSYVHFVSTLLDNLAVSRFVIVGNSLGGEVAWATAHAYPQRVEKLILIDSAGYNFDPVSVPLGFRIAVTPGLRTLATYMLPPGLVEKSVRNVYGDPTRISPELIARYTDLTRRAGNRTALGIRLAQRITGREQDIRDLKLPTLILWGGRDRLIPPIYAQRFATDIAGSKLVMFDSLGHVPQEEGPAATVAVVEAFL